MSKNVYGADCVYWMPTKKGDLKSLCEHYDVLKEECDYWLKGGECKSDGLINRLPACDGMVLRQGG